MWSQSSCQCRTPQQPLSHVLPAVSVSRSGHTPSAPESLRLTMAHRACAHTLHDDLLSSVVLVVIPVPMQCQIGHEVLDSRRSESHLLVGGDTCCLGVGGGDPRPDPRALEIVAVMFAQQDLQANDTDW